MATSKVGQSKFFLGKKKQTMVFCPPVIVGKDLQEIYTRAETSIVRVANTVVLEVTTYGFVTAREFV